MRSVEITELTGKVFTKVANSDDEAIVFTLADGSGYSMHHEQDCCECVSIDEIHGDLSDLEGTPILSATEDFNNEEPSKESYDESHTWTFYNIRTIKGSVTIRWYGSSNGYYSESVSIYKI